MKALILLLFSLTISLTGHAQFVDNVEDGFEPFADYSEFVEASTEETDINFFRYGRLLSVGVTGGYQGLNGDQIEFIKDGIEFGAFFTFYASINLGLRLSYKTSSHDASYFIQEINSNFEATTRFDFFSLHAKYILNTQNLTKSIAKYNPYIIGGISQVYRNTNTNQQVLVSSRDGAPSFDLGFGIEHIFNNNKNFIGLQGVYHLANFPNDNDPLSFTNDAGILVDSGLRFKGHIYSINFVLGFNF